MSHDRVVAVLLEHRAALDAALRLPFTLRGAYPVLAVVSGGVGILVVVLLIVARIVHSRSR